MHPPDEPCIAEEMLAKLVTALVRAGTIPESIILQLADDLDGEAQDETITRADELQSMATALRMWAIEAAGPTRAQWSADNRRKRFRVIEGEPEA